MKGVFAPSPSPYDVQSSELVGSLNKADGLIGCSVDVINSKQVAPLHYYKLLSFHIKCHCRKRCSVLSKFINFIQQFIFLLV